MKKFLLVILLLSISRIVSAQTYHRFLENTEWCERVCSFGGCSMHWYHRANDTIIGGVAYSIIDQPFGNQFYVREDTIAKKVFSKSDATTTEELIFDFSLQPGTIFNYSGSQFLLDSIDSISTQLGFRKQFLYHIIGSNLRATVVEGIGSLISPFEIFHFLSDPTIATICSYVGNQQYYDCGFDTCPPNPFMGLIPSVVDFEISVFGSGNVIYVAIQGTNTVGRLNVYSVTGSKVYSDDVSGGKHFIECNFDTGIYLAELTCGDEKMIKKVFVIKK